ncbi:MAG: FAD-binding oxidoreductase [Alphaproteobacteria bacterium]|nr:FAD-binding oxidoreductase [Alphaproteobacteria bacterium]
MSAPLPAAHATPTPELLQALKDAVGDKGWSDDRQDMAHHLVDERNLYYGVTPLLLRPATVDEVSACVRLCAEARVPIVPQGGNTGLVGGAVPFEHGGEILLCLSRMNRIREVDTVNDSMTAEAGCILETVQTAARDAGRYFPLSLGAQGSCQIGGNIATNAGGCAVLRYGHMRELVLGIEAVLPNGRVYDGLKSLRKDNSGYDLKQLLIGSEGTLGIITAGVLKLFPPPVERHTTFAGVASPEAALDLFSRAREALGDAVTAFELMPRIALDFVLAHIPGTRDPLAAPHPFYVLCEATATRHDLALADALNVLLEKVLEAGLINDATVAAGETQAQALWKLRESVSEAQKHEGGSIKHDISVPIATLPGFIGEASWRVEKLIPGVRVVAFGHVGDGNIHFNLSQPKNAEREAFLSRWDEASRLVHDTVVDMGGSISAEHGIGRLKRDELVRLADPLELDQMRAIKRTLDPHNIMNPGKLVLPG